MEVVSSLFTILAGFITDLLYDIDIVNTLFSFDLKRKVVQFKRDKNDIYLTLPLTITEAALGCEKEIPTINGNVVLDISSGTQNGDKLKLKGKGIPGQSSFSKGDMYVITSIVIPEKLDRHQKELLKELAETKLDNGEYKKIEKYL